MFRLRNQPGVYLRMLAAAALIIVLIVSCVSCFIPEGAEPGYCRVSNRGGTETIICNYVTTTTP